MERALRPSLPMLRPPIPMPPVRVRAPGGHYDYPSVPVSQNYIDYSQRLYGGAYQDDDFSWMDYAVGFESSQAAPARQGLTPLQYYGHQQQTQLSQWPMNSFQEPMFTQRLPPPTYRPTRPHLVANYVTKPIQPVNQRPAAPVPMKSHLVPRGPRPSTAAVKVTRQDKPATRQPPAKVRKVNPPMPMLPPPKTSGKVAVAKPPEVKAPSPPRPSHPLRNIRMLTGSIPKILRWNGSWMAVQQSKRKADVDPPPLYLTVGRLIGFWGGKDCHRSETRFLLEDLPHFASGNGISLKLHCTYYAIDQPFGSHVIGSTLRCVGLFFNGRDEKKRTVFQCVSLRPAEDSDIRFVVAREEKVQSMIDKKLI